MPIWLSKGQLTLKWGSFRVEVCSYQLWTSVSIQDELWTGQLLELECVATKCGCVYWSGDDSRLGPAVEDGLSWDPRYNTVHWSFKKRCWVSGWIGPLQTAFDQFLKLDSCSSEQCPSLSCSKPRTSVCTEGRFVCLCPANIDNFITLLCLSIVRTLKKVLADRVLVTTKWQLNLNGWYTCSHYRL